tara:strand:+ start:539 stop:829 length:291 start_codon:yes stop_codon:yes gene_type:complete
MAIEKFTEIPKMEIVNTWCIQVATDTIIKEDGVEISRSRHRHTLNPYTSGKNSDGSWTHTETDISDESSQVQVIANALWTDEIKTAYKTWRESREV